MVVRYRSTCVRVGMVWYVYMRMWYVCGRWYACGMWHGVERYGGMYVCVRASMRFVVKKIITKNKRGRKKNSPKERRENGLYRLLAQFGIIAGLPWGKAGWGCQINSM